MEILTNYFAGKQLRKATPFLAILAMLALLPGEAAAQNFNIPFIADFGCNIVKYLKGPLAVIVFIVVIAATFLIGMIAKMDWGRVISVAIIFGVLVGLGGLVANNPYISAQLGLTGCSLY